MQLPSDLGSAFFAVRLAVFAGLPLDVVSTGAVFAQPESQSAAAPHRTVRASARRIRPSGPRGLRMAGPPPLGLLALELALALRRALVLQELVLALRTSHRTLLTPWGRLRKAYQIASRTRPRPGATDFRIAKASSRPL